MFYQNNIALCILFYLYSVKPILLFPRLGILDSLCSPACICAPISTSTNSHVDQTFRSMSSRTRVPIKTYSTTRNYSLPSAKRIYRNWNRSLRGQKVFWFDTVLHHTQQKRLVLLLVLHACGNRQFDLLLF